MNNWQTSTYVDVGFQRIIIVIVNSDGSDRGLDRQVEIPFMRDLNIEG